MSSTLLDQKKHPPFARNFIRRFGNSVFCAVESESADSESFLENLWDHASLDVFLLHFGLAIFLSVLPPALFFHWRLFPFLSPTQKERFLERLFRSKIHLYRWTAHSVRASSLLFFFRSHRRYTEYFGERKEVRKNPPVLPKKTTRIADYIVIGSGAAGLTFAHTLARKGKDVVVLEEGSLLSENPQSTYELLQTRFRDFGYQTARGLCRFPVLQGTGVGGTYGVSGRILHPVPQAVYETWGLSKDIPYEKFEEAMFTQLQELSPTNADISALESTATLSRLGWKHTSMKVAASQWPTEPLRVLPDHRVLKIKLRRNRAEEVWLEKDGEPFSFAARKAIVLAGGAIHTPAILWNSGIESSSLGKNLQCHLSVSGTLEWEAPYDPRNASVEVRQFQEGGIKLAGQTIPPEALLLRTSVLGAELQALLRKTDRLSSWMANVRGSATGQVFFSTLRGPIIRWEPSRADCEKVRKAIHLLGTLALEMGAKAFYPGVTGVNTVVRDAIGLDRLASMDLDPRNYFLAAGHLFGSCAMGTDPETSVVDTSFRVRGTENLYCIDASLFPSNTGVNPLLGIMGFARLAAESL